jgi:hypothetical protein
MLFPEQHEDVQSAEIRFNKTDGHGMLFTNGTGTGKTFSGLGIIKRFFQKGTPNTLVIAPSQGILLDWQKAARSMGLEAHILDSTVDKGKGGLNLTTYANLGNNRHARRSRVGSGHRRRGAQAVVRSGRHHHRRAAHPARADAAPGWPATRAEHGAARRRRPDQRSCRKRREAAEWHEASAEELSR